MKFRLICVGKISEPFLREGIEEYASRIRRYVSLTVVELKEEKGGGKHPDPRFIREREGERILERIPASAFTIVLDEKGENLGSEDLAGLLGRRMLEGTSEIAWVIGGAWGLSDVVRKRGDLILSLSAMTFTHQMTRLFLLEQLYRAFTIVRNEPYHNR